MNYSRKFIALVYLLFTVLVNVQGVQACSIGQEKQHSCCCASSASCAAAEMNCCVDAPADDSQHFDHDAVFGPKILTFKLTTTNLFLVPKFRTEKECSKILVAKPPPNEKVFLVFHQLLFYA